MKKIGKLSINPRKIIDNSELKSIVGGTWRGTCDVMSDGQKLFSGPACGESKPLATYYCNLEYFPYAYCICYDS